MIHDERPDCCIIFVCVQILLIYGQRIFITLPDQVVIKMYWSITKSKRNLALHSSDLWNTMWHFAPCFGCLHSTTTKNRDRAKHMFVVQWFWCTKMSGAEMVWANIRHNFDVVYFLFQSHANALYSYYIVAEYCWNFCLVRWLW